MNVMDMIHLNNKTIDTQSLDFGRFDYREENPWLERAWFTDGTELTDSELDMLADKYPSELHMIFMERAF